MNSGRPRAPRAAQRWAWRAQGCSLERVQLSGCHTIRSQVDPRWWAFLILGVLLQKTALPLLGALVQPSGSQAWWLGVSGQTVVRGAEVSLPLLIHLSWNTLLLTGSFIGPTQTLLCPFYRWGN